MRSLTRWAAALTALVLSLTTLTPAPASASVRLQLTLELLVVDDQNESGNDEIGIFFIAPVAPGKKYLMWPDDRDRMNVNAGDCWYINLVRGCPNGYTNKSVGEQGPLPMYFTTGETWTFEIWEDDVTSSDDLILRESFTVGEEPYQELVFRGTRSGADYTLYARLS
ncbi:hypothetical protein [Nonomuraea sp. NPDC050310]|uniref:hypothetical protein n=1 Tax=unclassified Nonomuraea TaxID=2593643 RepID=UPI0033E2CD05